MVSLCERSCTGWNRPEAGTWRASSESDNDAEPDDD
jgi:hypothetical protein